MKLLIVAKSESIHTARWIDQLHGSGIQIHLFPSGDYGENHPALRHVAVHHSIYARELHTDQSVQTKGLNLQQKYIAAAARRLKRLFQPAHRARQLAKLIDTLKPDVIHSLEIQGGGYLTLEAKQETTQPFPPWIVTNWGSDIYLFGRDQKHRERIKQVLAKANYYSSECARDVRLAKELGFRGKVLPVLPNSGGFDLAGTRELRQKGLTSSRKLIMLKGYQGWSGRALTALEALEDCQALLRDYTVVVYSADAAVAQALGRFEQRTGIKTRLIPRGTSHNEILRLQGAARISIALGMSDAISTAVLEAMVMGSYPIQSDTSCADEWIRNAQTGSIVPPEDAAAVAHALRQALQDDDLVNKAAALNWQVARQRLQQKSIAEQVINMYREIAAQSH